MQTLIDRLKCELAYLVSVLSQRLLYMVLGGVDELYASIKLIARYIFYLEHPCKINALFYSEIETYVANLDTQLGALCLHCD
jgi:hypothetical protein